MRVNYIIIITSKCLAFRSQTDDISHIPFDFDYSNSVIGKWASSGDKLVDPGAMRDNRFSSMHLTVGMTWTASRRMLTW